MARPERDGYDGLAQVAHAIRRSAALYVAMSILPPDATVDDLKDQAEDLARWIGGRAMAAETQQPDSGGSLGQPWPPTD